MSGYASLAARRTRLQELLFLHSFICLSFSCLQDTLSLTFAERVATDKVRPVARTRSQQSATCKAGRTSCIGHQKGDTSRRLDGKRHTRINCAYKDRFDLDEAVAASQIARIVLFCLLIRFEAAVVFLGKVEKSSALVPMRKDTPTAKTGMV